MTLAQRIQIDSATQSNLERGLNEYLETEKLLITFYSNLNYCMPNCISPKGIGLRAGIGCCNSSYHNLGVNMQGMDFPYKETALEMLEDKRIKLYGKPKNLRHGYRCGYHTEEGCRVKSYKPMICLAWLCVPARQYMHESGLWKDYTFEFTRDTLSKIVTGNMNPKELHQFQSKIKRLIGKTGK